MIFPRYIEARTPLDKKPKACLDPVDAALVAFGKAQKRCNKRNIPSSKRSESWTDHSWSKWLNKGHELETEKQTAYLAVFAAADAHPDWIYRFMSPFGEAFVKTLEEAVAICAKVEAIGLSGKRFEKWREGKLLQVRASVELIKLGADGGTAGRVR